MPPNPHTAQAKALRQTKPARRRAGLFIEHPMKLTPVTNTIFYGPEKSMAAERERNRRFWEGKAYTPPRACAWLIPRPTQTKPGYFSRHPPGRTASTTAATPAGLVTVAFFCMNGGRDAEIIKAA